MKEFLYLKRQKHCISSYLSAWTHSAPCTFMLTCFLWHMPYSISGWVNANSPSFPDPKGVYLPVVFSSNVLLYLQDATIINYTEKRLNCVWLNVTTISRSCKTTIIPPQLTKLQTKIEFSHFYTLLMHKADATNKEYEVFSGEVLQRNIKGHILQDQRSPA